MPFAMSWRVHSSVHSASIAGAGARPVEVQVDLALGLPGFHLVGLPDHACQDARTRVLTALRNTGYQLPQKKITVNLAPGDQRKEGPAFDLPIAVGILAAAGLVRMAEAPPLLVGELALSGDLLPVRGVLPIALEARRMGVRTLIVPEPNGAEAALVEGLRVLGARTLVEAVELFADPGSGKPCAPTPPAPPSSTGDLADVRGQGAAKWALEVAAAGGHNALFIGPPGAGKTMLARRLPGLLPALSFEEAVEATSIWSVAGRLKPGRGLLPCRPFRAPHHTISVAGLIGGGTPLRPGEISLAHHGVLFMDELPEFGRAALEALRQPLEDGEVSLVRAKDRANIPARFMLIGAMNPCPCGHAADADPGRCGCTDAAKDAYGRRVSGPILDRFDLHIEVGALRTEDFLGQPRGESSADVRERVERARAVQRRRYARVPGLHCNGQLSGPAARRLTEATEGARLALAALIDQKRLSARAHDRILKLARTIADCSGDERVTERHVLGAGQLRCLDRAAEAKRRPCLPPLQVARQAALLPDPGVSPGELPREGT
jgi:magnesium chelatase family protein